MAALRYRAFDTYKVKFLAGLTMIELFTARLTREF